MRSRIILLLLGFLLNVSDSLAYKPDQPKRHNVFSPNLQFIVDVDPRARIQSVYAAKDQKTPLWTVHRGVGFGQVVLSNDGQVMALIHWEFFSVEDRDETCLEFWNKTGIFKSYRYSELCPDPPGTGWFYDGPVGRHWRVWYEFKVQDQDTLTITTTDLFEYDFSLEDGEILGRRLILPNLCLKWWWLLVTALLVTGAVSFIIWRRKRNLNKGPDARSGARLPVGASNESITAMAKKNPE